MANQLALIASLNGLTLLEDNAQWTNRFEIKSETSNRIYVISQNKKSKIWGCSCPGWITRRKCKHLFSIQDVISTISELQEKENVIKYLSE